MIDIAAPRLGRRLFWLSVFLTGALLAASGRAAAAGPPSSATGTFVQASFVPANFRGAGGVTLFDFTEHDVLAGTFSGTSVIDGSCVVQPSGDSVCRGFETFTGTVDGNAGTATFHDVVFIDATGALSGSFTIVGGTGALSSLHGHGTFSGAGGTGTYAGQLVSGG